MRVRARACVLAMKAGASGYVLKGAAASELMNVLKMVNAGEVYVAPGLAWGLLREMSKPRSAPLDELSTRVFRAFLNALMECAAPAAASASAGR